MLCNLLQNYLSRIQGCSIFQNPPPPKMPFFYSIFSLLILLCQIPTEAGAADVLAKGILTAWEYYGKSG